MTPILTELIAEIVQCHHTIDKLRARVAELEQSPAQEPAEPPAEQKGSE